jgi:hypothetical protein
LRFLGLDQLKCSEKASWKEFRNRWDRPEFHATFSYGFCYGMLFERFIYMYWFHHVHGSITLNWDQMLLVHCIWPACEMLHWIDFHPKQYNWDAAVWIHCIWYWCVKLQDICIKSSPSCVDPLCCKSVPTNGVQIVLTHCILHVCAMLHAV